MVSEAYWQYLAKYQRDSMNYIERLFDFISVGLFNSPYAGMDTIVFRYADVIIILKYYYTDTYTILSPLPLPIPPPPQWLRARGRPIHSIQWRNRRPVAPIIITLNFNAQMCA